MSAERELPKPVPMRAGPQPAGSRPAGSEPQPSVGLSVVLVLGASLLALIVANAWLCDDAFITLRSAKNLVEGRGPVFNAPWRVQTYTHPAWMLLLALGWALTREAFFTTLALGVFVSAAALVVGLRSCKQWAAALVCAGTLACSRAFVEFSTSGLENPLTHLVIAAGAALLLRSPGARPSVLAGPEGRLRAAGLLLSAAFLSRPDAVLLLAPLFIHIDRGARSAGVTQKQRARAWVLGASPALAWELFSLVYYGALVPNTALAKLGLGLDTSELILRGLSYLGHTAKTDPVSFVLILCAVIVPWLPGRAGAPELRALSRGAAAYLIYVIVIGGDFMEGRFLSAVALCGALALGQLRWSGPSALAMLCATAVVAGFGARPSWKPDAGETKPRIKAGIADERSYYAASASLLAWRSGRAFPDHRWRTLGVAGPDDGGRVALFSTMGFYGFYADPELHVIDGFAIGDPVLARLPPIRRLDWKPGHLPRAIPDGYVETLAGDPWQIRVEDPEVAHLYEIAARVHLAPLLSKGRARAIVELLSGRASAPIDARRYHLAELITMRAGALARRGKPLRMRDAGVEIEFGRDSHALPLAELELSLSPGQRYALIFYAGDSEVERRELALAEVIGGALTPCKIDPPVGGFERLHILPLTMHGRRSLALSAVRVGRN